ncbi:hypothetical protein SABIM44S_03000 [Streptomyces abikoensis]
MTVAVPHSSGPPLCPTPEECPVCRLLARAIRGAERRGDAQAVADYNAARDKHQARYPHKITAQ